MKRKKDDSMNLDMEQVYHTYERMVYQFLYMRTRDAQWSQDLMQETFLRAVTSISRYDGSCKLSVWLCQIAKHVLWQELRRRNRTELTELDDTRTFRIRTARLMPSGMKTGWNSTAPSTNCLKKSGKLSCTASPASCPSGRSVRFLKKAKTGRVPPFTVPN